MKYEVVIGLEVHTQLSTHSKAFSPDSSAFGGAANTHIDPISLGHPGTLPVLNKTQIDYAILMGLATHCSITPYSVIARKHYFYPDNPKAYQISQFEAPICENGFLDIEVDGQTKRIGITRIHVEEDAGKSIHDLDPFATLVDLNRCGVPLCEVVSEPDMRSAEEAVAYLQKLHQIVRWLGVCDGNMEEGSFRCDANISIRPFGQVEFGTKTELKNMNSFRNVEKAIQYEIKRQIKVVESGEKVIQETRLWDVTKMETRAMRQKEDSHDYRYFPDPDLPPVVLTQAQIESYRTQLPKMPEAIFAELSETLGLSAYDANILLEEKERYEYFDKALNLLDLADKKVAAKALVNVIMGDVMREQGESTLRDFPIQPERLAQLVKLRLENKISSTGQQDIFAEMLLHAEMPEVIATQKNLLQVSNDDALTPVVESVLADFPNEVERFKNGEKKLTGFFMGQIMRRFEGSPDPKRVQQLIAELIG